MPTPSRTRSVPYAQPAPHPADAVGPGAAPAGALAERRPLELAARGLTWVHLDRPDPETRERARRALRLARARRRGRALEAPAAEDRRVPGVPLRRPPLPGLRQGDPAAERGRARRLPRAGLPRHAAERRAAARSRGSSTAARRTSSCARSCSPRAPAACSTRCSTTSSTTASRSSTRSATSSTRSRTTCSSGAPRTSSATSRT